MPNTCCKYYCLSAVDEQATAEAQLVLDDPIDVAVPADTEEPRQRGRSRRGRFGLNHDASPLSDSLAVNGQSGDRRRSSGKVIATHRVARNGTTVPPSSLP